MSQKKPIGVFDSGLGGLTVVKELIKVLPHEDIIYLGDTARVPYGPRSPKIIQKFSEENTEFLLKKNVKAVVIACNTSSAVAADYLRKKFKNVPIFEVIEPASIDAVKDGSRIGIIGTYGTVASGAYPKTITKLGSDIKVFSKACPLFVPFIEEGEIEGKALEIVVKKYLEPLKKQKITTLILGCTHYPIIKEAIGREIGKRVNLINPGHSIALEVAGFLKKKNLLNSQKRHGDVSFFVTDLTDRFIKMAEMFLSRKIEHKLQKVEL